jgi:hypothetical protein
MRRTGNHPLVVLLLVSVWTTSCYGPAPKDTPNRPPRLSPTPSAVETKISDIGDSASDKTSTSRPNVLLVVLDTVRPDYLGFMGADKEIAPFLGELAKDSAVFDNALSTSSWTAPSTASIFTGL